MALSTLAVLVICAVKARKQICSKIVVANDHIIHKWSVACMGPQEWDM